MSATKTKSKKMKTKKTKMKVQGEAEGGAAVTAERVTLSGLHPPAGSHRARIRKGRGPGSGIGKTAGRGGKGQTARSGGRTPPRVGGGPKPPLPRLPKRGFPHPFTRPGHAVYAAASSRAA